MKCYIIQSSSGSYDDYSTAIEKIFIDKEKAEVYLKKINERHEELQESAKQCYRCYMHEFSNKDCPKRKIVDNQEYGYDSCENYNDNYYYYENHPAKIIEEEITE